MIYSSGYRWVCDWLCEVLDAVAGPDDRRVAVAKALFLYCHL